MIGWCVCISEREIIGQDSSGQELLAFVLWLLGLVDMALCNGGFVQQIWFILDNVTKIINQVRAEDGVHINFSKAFDKFAHDRLVQKIKSYESHNGFKLDPNISLVIEDRVQDKQVLSWLEILMKM